MIGLLIIPLIAVVLVTFRLALTLLFVIVRQKVRWHGVRWAILWAAMGLDIFFSARYLVDRIL